MSPCSRTSFVIGCLPINHGWSSTNNREEKIRHKIWDSRNPRLFIPSLWLPPHSPTGTIFFNSLKTEKSHYNPKNKTEYFTDFVKISQALRAYKMWRLENDGLLRTDCCEKCILLKTACRCSSGACKEEAMRELQHHQNQFRQEEVTSEDFNTVVSLLDYYSSFPCEVFKRDIDLSHHVYIDIEQFLSIIMFSPTQFRISIHPGF